MSVDNRLVEIRGAQRQIETVQEELRRMKAGGDGGDGAGGQGVETRVGRLEAGQDDIKKTLGDIKVTLATLDERTKHMPTRWEAFLIVAGIVGVIGGSIGIAVRFIPG